MKKVTFFGMMALLVGSSSAFAEGEPTSLTTKNYVDQGLIEVNNRIKTVQTTANTASSTAAAASATATAASNKVDTLEATVGNSSDGLVKEVNDLKTTVGDNTSGLVKKVNDLEGQVGATYTGGVGISVNQNNEIGLDGLDGAEDNKMYVFKNGAWVELPVTNTFNPNILD